MSILDTIMDLVAPHDCVGCNLEGSLLCSSCIAALMPPRVECYHCGSTAASDGVCARCKKRAPIIALRAAARYEGFARDLVFRLKYARAQAAARPMADLMARTCSIESDWLITFAPTTAARVRTRGYDQAELLAKALARQLQCPALGLLRRLGQDHQIGRSGEQRRRQMKQAFLVRRPDVVRNTKIVLVDDVITTGATLDAAAEALRQAGAQCVEAIVFARA